MNICQLEQSFCLQNHLGIAPANQVRFAPHDLTRLIQYSNRFFQGAPALAQIAAGSTGPKRSMFLNGFEMTFASLMDKQNLNLSFLYGTLRSYPSIKNQILPSLSELTEWTRDYVNQMPQDLKMRVFSQKLQQNEGYGNFMASHPAYRLIDIRDSSSGRYSTNKSVYKLVFYDGRSGKEMSYLIKPHVPCEYRAYHVINEEFYSRYLFLFDRNPVAIRLYGNLNFIEFVGGIPSIKLAPGLRLDPKFYPIKDELIVWFAQEAALADALNKGDRYIGFESGAIWGQYIMVLDEGGQHLARMVSIDHEYINQTDKFTISDAEGAGIEMAFLAACPGFEDKAQRRQLFEQFRFHYTTMFSTIRKRKDEVKDLILHYYGDPERIKAFEINLNKDLDAWLSLLFEKMIAGLNPGRFS